MQQISTRIVCPQCGGSAREDTEVEIPRYDTTILICTCYSCQHVFEHLIDHIAEKYVRAASVPRQHKSPSEEGLSD